MESFEKEKTLVLRNNISGENTNIKKYEDDIYMQALPKNELKFLASIRQWERKMGFITPIRWTNAILISSFHIMAVITFLYTFSSGMVPTWETVFFGK